MPSGGGAIGGGGGGGFSGGGVYSGWSSGRTGGYGDDGGKCDCKTAVAWTVAVIVTILLTVVLPIAITLPLGSSGSSTSVDIATDFYSPGDSRLLSFSSFFYESLSLDVDSADTGASLTVVNSPPLLTARNSFNISVKQDLIPRNYHFWQYYLYPGSNISINVCTIAESSVLYVYVVKGNSNANEWGRSPSSRHAELVEVDVETCPQDSVITYTTNEEDEYYIFFWNWFGFSSVSYSATLQFERFEYALPTTNTSTDSCSAASGEQCTVGVPYGTGSQQVLVTTTIPENVDWGENVDVNIKCNSRHWALAIVVLFPVTVAIAVVVGLLICIILYCKHKR